MHPIVTLFGKELGVYGICSVIGLALAAFIGLKLCKRRGIEWEYFTLTFIGAGLGLLIGSHILYAVTRISEIINIFSKLSELSFSGFWSNIAICFGGAVFYGGFLGGLAGVLIACRIINGRGFQKFIAGKSATQRQASDKVLTSTNSFDSRKRQFSEDFGSDLPSTAQSSYIRDDKSALSKSDMLDIYAVCVPLFHVFGRIGCFFAGCCFGIPSSFGFIITGNIYNPEINDIRRFPVQLLESFICLIIFIVLLIIFLAKTPSPVLRIPPLKREGKPLRLLRRHLPLAGEANPSVRQERTYPLKRGGRGILIFIYMLIYAPCRFFLEFLRGDEIRGFLGPLSTSQYISIALVIAGIIGCIFWTRSEFVSR